MDIRTQGIRYSGSKKELIPQILSLIPNGCKNLLDGCSGTTRVAQAFKKVGYNTDCNDVAAYGKVFGECFIGYNKLDTAEIAKLIAHLNCLEPKSGWFSTTYGGDPILAGILDSSHSSIAQDGKKKNWQLHNTQKADAIREEIEILGIDSYTKSVLITSLILALDKVDNNLGHQVAYLREWSKRSYGILKLEIPQLIYGAGSCNVLQQDVKTIKNAYDLVYLDIPYGTSNLKTKTTRVRYNSYYHIWNSIALWDKPPVFGASNRRIDSSDKVANALSVFEDLSENTVFNAIKNTCSSLDTKYIIFSYNNKSKIPIPSLYEMFRENFKVLNVLEIAHKENVQKSLTINNKYLADSSQNYEYLFLLQK